MTILTELQAIATGADGLTQAKNLLAGLSATVANAAFSKSSLNINIE